MVKLQESNGRYSVFLPKNMINKKGWVKGQELFIVFNERGNIELCDDMKK